jgi:hypothetical protein
MPFPVLAPFRSVPVRGVESSVCYKSTKLPFHLSSFFTMQHPFPVPSPISILPFNTTTHPLYSLRANADASTPSTSSIDTPVHDRFLVQPTPMTANESCQGYTYSGQAVHPCQCMPLDPLASEYSKPYPNGEGAICGYQPALLNPHRVMCKWGCCPSGT